MKNFLTSKVSMFIYGSAVGSFMMFAAFAVGLSQGIEVNLKNGLKLYCIRTE